LAPFGGFAGVVNTVWRLGLNQQAYLTWMFARRGTRMQDFGFTAALVTPAGVP
jgi:hypothetical protein